MNTWRNRITWIRTGHLSRMPVHVAMDDHNVSFVFSAISSCVASFQSLSLSYSRHKTLQRGLEDGVLITMPSRNSKSQKPAQVGGDSLVSASKEMRSFSKHGPFLKAEHVEGEVSNFTRPL